MRICGMPECGNKASGRGLCNRHYQMWYKGEDIPTFALSGPHSNMQPDIKIVKPNNLQLGWLIGLLEGEGHFSYSGTQQLVLGMTDEDVVLRFKLLIEQIVVPDKPLHVIVTNWRTTEQTLFTIRLYGAKARAIMKLIVRYMSNRRRVQIWRALNKYNPPNLKLDLKQLVVNINANN